MSHTIFLKNGLYSDIIIKLWSCSCNRSHHNSQAMTSVSINKDPRIPQNSQKSIRNAVKGGKTSSKDRKLALQQDVMLMSSFSWIPFIFFGSNLKLRWIFSTFRLTGWRRSLGMKRTFTRHWKELWIGLWEPYLVFLLISLPMLVKSLSLSSFPLLSLRKLNSRM